MDSFLQVKGIELLCAILVAIGFIFGLLIKWYYDMHLKNVKDEFFKLQKGERSWYGVSDKMPCPGALIVCKTKNGAISRGYAIGLSGQIVLAEIPPHLYPPDIEVKCKYTPLKNWAAWTYAEDYIRPSDVLMSNEKKYELWQHL